MTRFQRTCLGCLIGLITSRLVAASEAHGTSGAVSDGHQQVPQRTAPALVDENAQSGSLASRSLSSMGGLDGGAGS